MVLAAVGLASCGGSANVPADYEELARALELGRSRLVSCSTTLETNTVVEILTLTNPGELPVEIRSVELLDGSSEVEFFVASRPSDFPGAWFGNSPLDNLGELQPLWDARRPPPAAIPPGHIGGVVVELPLPDTANAVGYLSEYQVTIVIDDQERSYRWNSLRMAGSTEDCAALQAQLEANG